MVRGVKVKEASKEEHQKSDQKSEFPGHRESISEGER